MARRVTTPEPVDELAALVRTHMSAVDIAVMQAEGAIDENLHIRYSKNRFGLKKMESVADGTPGWLGTITVPLGTFAWPVDINKTIAGGCFARIGLYAGEDKETKKVKRFYPPFANDSSRPAFISLAQVIGQYLQLAGEV